MPPADQPWRHGGSEEEREPEIQLPVQTVRAINAAIKSAHRAGPNVMAMCVALAAVIFGAYMGFRGDNSARLDRIEADVREIRSVLLKR